MLSSLAINDVVLIEKADIAFDGGLCVLTGETGAGKSILLESLGLALGMRAAADLVRDQPTGKNLQAEKTARAVVTASFIIEPGNEILNLLTEHDLASPEPEEPLILRRTIDANGRSRAFINDQPVSAALLRRIGEMLVEIEGQFASQGLLDTGTHRNSLDEFGGLSNDKAAVSTTFTDWKVARDALSHAEANLEEARADEEYLRHATEELTALDPQTGEEKALAQTRSLLRSGETLTEGLIEAEASLTKGEGIEDQIGNVQSMIARLSDTTPGILDTVQDALGRASDDVAEALSLLHAIMAATEPDPARLEACEDRLFTLRAVARKHHVTVDDLPALCLSLVEKLDQLEQSGTSLDELRTTRDKARELYLNKAARLGKKRQRAATALDKAIAAELPPLRLEKAAFTTIIEELTEADWGPAGTQHVHFNVRTNPGTPFAPLAKIASGGELARFLLALKMVLHTENGIPTLVFDEVDAGIGGATAAAVGQRLAKLARDAQVLVITHSPQVAASAAQHLRVSKNESNGQTKTMIEELSITERREEIARMLAGSSITEEARAAATSLMNGSLE
jgi:DNA repair protein RecN (Recombination protein N)